MAKINEWMSVSDLMTGLMIIFLFIAVAYMSRVRKDISEYADTKKELYEKISNSFKKEQETDNKLHVSKDLSMRFLKASTLFPFGGSELTDSFKITLNEIMPKYLDILADLDSTQSTMVKEIRVEGHTDDTGYPSKHSDPYRANLILSQERARNVMFHIMDIIESSGFDEEKKDWFKHLFTANGYSFSRALDSDYQYVYDTHNPIDAPKSRRVEIRIIIDDRSVIEKLLNKEKND